MPINKIVASFDEAVADIQDGATIMVGGFGTVTSTASLLLEAVARKGVKNLTTISNTTGFGSDVWKLMGHKFAEDMDILVRNGHIKKAIASAPVSTIYENNFEKLLRAGKVDLEMVPQGTLAERVRAGKAGLGGVYIPVGAGTKVEEGKETKIIDGKKYILELALKADFALAEVDEIVELGELGAEVIVTPGVYVDRVVVRPSEISEEEGEISAEAKESHRRYLERGSA